MEKNWLFKFIVVPVWSVNLKLILLKKFEYRLNLAPLKLLYVIKLNGKDIIGILQIIERFDPNWLFIFPVGRFVLMHIHWRGERLAGVFDINIFNADVLYKSFVEQPNNDKQF